MKKPKKYLTNKGLKIYLFKSGTKNSRLTIKLKYILKVTFYNKLLEGIKKYRKFLRRNKFLLKIYFLGFIKSWKSKNIIYNFYKLEVLTRKLKKNMVNRISVKNEEISALIAS